MKGFLRLTLALLLSLAPLTSSTVAAHPFDESTLTNHSRVVTPPRSSQLTDRAFDLPLRPIQPATRSELAPLPMPLAAGIPATITVQVVPNTLVANSSATAAVIVTAREISGTPASEVTLNAVVTPSTLGSVVFLTQTNASGEVTGTWTAGSVVGTGTIEVGDGVVSGTATISLTVASLNSITVTPGSANVVAGQTQSFTASGSDQYGNSVIFTPNWTTDGGTINVSGLFAAQNTVASGRIVTATSGSISGTATVNIVAGPLASIIITPSLANVAAGQIQNFTAGGFDALGNSVAIAPVWSTNGGNINAGTGQFTAQSTVASGRIVTATSGSISGTATVNVVAGSLNSITVLPNPATVVAGGSQLFTATGFDINLNPVPITPTWSSDAGSINPTIGVLTAQTGVASGRRVTATFNSVTGFAAVNIIAGPLNSITVLPNPATIAAGGTQLFTATGFDINLNPVPITPTWSSDAGSMNPTTGVLTAQTGVASGRRVTATFNSVTGFATVNIVAGALASITVIPNPATVAAGGTLTFTANGFDALGNPVTITPIWSSNAGSINSSSGVLTAQTTVASGRLVTATSGSISGTATVNIIAGPLASIFVTPSAVTLTVATTRTFTASGFDAFSNPVPITPSWTTNGGLISSSGVYTAQTSVASGRRVTATFSAISGFAVVNLIPAAPFTLTLSPATTTITAGTAIAYTAIATDTYGNSIGNVTLTTTFGISPGSGGAFVGNTITPTVRGTYAVTGTNGAAIGTGTLIVDPGTLNRLNLEDAPAGTGITITARTLTVYDTLTAYAVGYDVFNNRIGAQSVTWTGTGVVNGRVSPTTGISTTFTPVVSGTGVIRGTTSGITDTTGTITVQAPVMEITKTASPDPITPGGTLQYFLTYRNTGNAAARSVIVTETYPLSTTFLSANPSPTTTNNIWLLGNLLAGNSGTIVVNLNLAPQMPVSSVLTNTVRISADRANTAIYTTTTPVNSLPNVSVTISDTVDFVRPGDLLTYTIRYRNDGNAPVTGVQITATYPSQVAFVSATPPANIGDNVWQVPVLLGLGQSGFITVTVRVNRPMTDLTLLNGQAAIDSNETVPFTSTHATLVRAPILQLTQATNPATPIADQLLTYTLSYENNGSSYAANAVISNSLPANTTYQSCGPGSCSASAGRVTWNLGQIPSPGVGSATLTVRVNNNLPDGTLLTNIATLTSTEIVTALASLMSTVTSVPDLTLAVSDNTAAVAADETVTYQITYTNTGTAPAPNVILTDTIPAYVSFMGCSGCVAQSGNAYTFDLGTLNAAQTGGVTISVKLNSTLPPGLRAITNTVNIGTPLGEVITNNVAVDTNTITTMPVLALDVGFDGATPYPGKTITFTVRYTNTSAMDTTGVYINLDRSLFISSTPPGDAYPIGPLAARQSGIVTYVLTLPPTFTLAMNAFTNTFTIQDDGPGGLSIARRDVTTTIGVPDVFIESVMLPTSIGVGQKFTATLTIRNGGLGRACNPKQAGCGALAVDIFIDPATPPPSYPFATYGNDWRSVPALAPGQATTVTFSNIVFGPNQRWILYFKVDNWDCNVGDPCLPSRSRGGLVPEYNEGNNVFGPVKPLRISVMLPLIVKNKRF